MAVNAAYHFYRRIFLPEHVPACCRVVQFERDGIRAVGYRGAIGRFQSTLDAYFGYHLGIELYGEGAGEGKQQRDPGD